MDFINTDQAPKAIGPYSQAVVAGGFIFVSGQLGINPKNGELADDIESQTLQAFSNLEAVLKASGASLENVVKAHLFLKDLEDFAVVNGVYEGEMPHKPARITLEVSRLPKDALIEIGVIAYKG
jgi:2-iminobutanoate/2-iminopropanoate deaminase